MPETSDQDKIFLAQAVAQEAQLEADLGNFAAKIDELFQVRAPMKLTPIEKAELDTLRTAIRGAAATNNQRARILELINKGLETV